MAWSPVTGPQNWRLTGCCVLCADKQTTSIPSPRPLPQICSSLEKPTIYCVVFSAVASSRYHSGPPSAGRHRNTRFQAKFTEFWEGRQIYQSPWDPRTGRWLLSLTVVNGAAVAAEVGLHQRSLFLALLGPPSARPPVHSGLDHQRLLPLLLLLLFQQRSLSGMRLHMRTPRKKQTERIRLKICTFWSTVCCNKSKKKKKRR